MLREVLKSIVYKYSAFLNFPEHIHKYIWNVVMKKFLSFQFFKTTFPKKNSSSRDALDEDIFIQEFREDCLYLLYYLCFLFSTERSFLLLSILLK